MASDTSPRTLLAQLAEANPDLAGDLLEAVRLFTRAETRLIAVDYEAGERVDRRIDQLARLETIRGYLERELGTL